MSSLLPIRSDPKTGDTDPRVVDLEGEEAEAVFSALSSSTAREIVASLHEEPRTQSEIAETLDTTVQNVRYHLDKLEAAGLVEVVDTWYSSRGNEMAVYAPADGALIVSGDRNEASRLRTALSQLVGGVAVVGLAALLVQSLFGIGGPFEPSGPARENPGAVNDSPSVAVEQGTESTEAVNNTTEAVTTTATDPTVIDAVATAGGLPPGLLFFLGGVSVLVVVVALAHWRGS